METMNRRKFLKILGGTGALVVLGSGCQNLDLSAIGVQSTCKFGLVNDPWPGECRDYVDRNGNGICDLSEVEETETASADTQTDLVKRDNSGSRINAETEQTGEELVVLCRKGCQYPGHCNRYVDSNGSGICDLTEGVPYDQMDQSDTFERNKGSRRPGNRF